MATVHVNFTDVSDSGFEPVPAGDYLVQVVSVEEREGSKAPYLAVELEVMEPEEHAGRKLFDNLSLSEKALFRLKNVLLAAGYTAEELGGEIEIDPEDLVGTEFSVKVNVQVSADYGEQNRIKRYNPA